MKKKESTNKRVLLGWRCASCDQLITSIDDGWVEWRALENGRDVATLSGVRLIHRHGVRSKAGKSACHYDPRKQLRNQAGIVEGLALEYFVGPNGLLLLLSIVEAGEFPREDIVELARRVQVPGYELSRASGISDGGSQIAKVKPRKSGRPKARAERVRA